MEKMFLYFGGICCLAVRYLAIKEKVSIKCGSDFRSGSSYPEILRALFVIRATIYTTTNRLFTSNHISGHVCPCSSRSMFPPVYVSPGLCSHGSMLPQAHITHHHHHHHQQGQGYIDLREQRPGGPWTCGNTDRGEYRHAPPKWVHCAKVEVGEKANITTLPYSVRKSCRYIAIQ